MNESLPAVREKSTLARIPPQNLEAEEHVLGAMLLSEKALLTALEQLKPEQFYRNSHGLIFKAAELLYQDGTPPDPVTLARKLEELHAPLDQERSWLDIVGGKERIQELSALTPSTSNIAHYCKIVRDAWGKRECIRLFTDPMRGAWNGATPQTVLREVENACVQLYGMIEDDGTSRTISSANAAIKIEERVKAGGDGDRGVKPPFGFLDNMVPGGLYILGGYAKDGKTCVAAQAVRESCEAGLNVGMATIEMPEPMLTERIVSTFGVPYGPLRHGIVADGFKQAFENALYKMARWHLTIHDDPACDIGDLYRYQKLGHYDFLVIDHLHQMAYEEARDARLRLSANVKAIAKLARQADIPILLLAQFHRPTGTDAFPRPTMQSFKETGAIEQVATGLWAVYRKRDKDTGRRTAETEFLVLADRFGEDKHESLYFSADYQRFEEVDWRWNGR